jgi:hypothetical protein
MSLKHLQYPFLNHIVSIKGTSGFVTTYRYSHSFMNASPNVITDTGTSQGMKDSSTAASLSYGFIPDFTGVSNELSLPMKYVWTALHSCL